MSEENATTEEVVETTTETAEASEKAFVDTFLESITDDDIKSQKHWDNLRGKDADELGRYITELKSFTGKKGDIPKSLADGGTQEEWDAFHQKLGRPDDINGYDWNLGDDFREVVGEQAPFYEKLTDSFKDAVFKAGLDSDKSEEIYNSILSEVAGQFEEVANIRTEREKEIETSLKNEWGDSREGIERSIKATLVDNGGLEESDVDELISAGLLKEPKLAVALGKIASKFDVDPEIGTLQASTQAGLEIEGEELQNVMKAEYKEHGRVLPGTSKKYARWQERMFG